MEKACTSTSCWPYDSSCSISSSTCSARTRTPLRPGAELTITRSARGRSAPSSSPQPSLVASNKQSQHEDNGNEFHRFPQSSKQQHRQIICNKVVEQNGLSQKLVTALYTPGISLYRHVTVMTWYAAIKSWQPQVNLNEEVNIGRIRLNLTNVIQALEKKVTKIIHGAARSK